MLWHTRLRTVVRTALGRALRTVFGISLPRRRRHGLRTWAILGIHRKANQQA
jgi:hypothetical protein